MRELFFSIIIPVFNNQKYLKKCLSSVLNQKFKNYEILIIDDHSSDNSKKICKDFLIKNKNIVRLISNHKNLGVGKSRNIGLRNSKGRYIIFLDSDDYLMDQGLINLKRTIEKKNFPDVILNHISQNKEPKNNLFFLKNFQNKKINKNNFLKTITKNKLLINECWRLTISKELIDKKNLSFKSIQIAEDASFIFKVLIKMNNIAVNKNKFLFHRSRLNSLKFSIGIAPAFAYLSVLSELLNYKKKYLKDKTVSNYLKLKMSYILSNVNIYLNLLKDNEVPKLAKKIRKIYNKTNLKGYISAQYKSTKGIGNKIKSNIISSEKKVIHRIDGKLKKGESIILYGAGIITLSVLKILKKQKYNIRYILDDDPIWKGRKLSKIRVNEAIYLKNKKIIKNNLFVICNISSNVLNKIKNKLLKLNIKKDKIVCFDL